MSVEYTVTARRLGVASAAIVVVLQVAYAVTLIAGFLSLRSPEQPIGDPMFGILEILILLMMPALVALMVAVHAWAPAQRKALTLVAVVLFAAPVFTGGRLASSIRLLMVASGLLALAGLGGVVAGDMQLRNVGIVGYLPLFLVAVVLMGVLFHRTDPVAP